MKKNKRFIEISFPVKEVSIESAREKNIRHGLAYFHLAYMVGSQTSGIFKGNCLCFFNICPKNDLEWDKKRQFIIELSKWENSLNPVQYKGPEGDFVALDIQVMLFTMFTKILR